MPTSTGTNFYKINFEREVVLQGKSTTFLTINRNDDVLSAAENLYVMIYPNTRTFESVGVFEISQSTSSGAIGANESEGFIQSDLTEENKLRLNNIGKGLYVKNTQDFISGSTGPVTVEDIAVLNTPDGDIMKVSLTGPIGPYIGAIGNTATKIIDVGYYSDIDKNNWRINTVSVGDLEKMIYTIPAIGNAVDFTSTPNPFDGSIYSSTGSSVGGFTGTGAVSRSVNGFSSSIIGGFSPGMTENRGVTFRIDYEGTEDSHMKLNLLVFRYDTTDPTYGPLSASTFINMPEGIAEGYSTENFGFKSGLSGFYSENVDYQEVHLFGYTNTTVRTSRTTYQNNVPAADQVYDDRSSYGVLKTNPLITGNVKLTVDSTGSLFLDSFDANPQLADSKYKRYTISPESQYQTDLFNFFKGAPPEVIYQLYQIDNSYQNTKRELWEQYDNFYNYGVEQLASKFYDEDFSFLAPLWVRKHLPDYFVVFRVDHPASVTSYEGGTRADLFNELFSQARIVKTFDMRPTSKLGRYLQKLVSDPRFKERPLEVSYDTDVATTWYGISYKDGTITGKGEFLSDFWTKDQPIKEVEQYITEGFQRNGIISTNLINLTFLFDDPEASLYSINRYFGLYVSENQLADFEIAANVLGMIPDQSPEPKPGVDGGPYSTRPFIQTNPNGIELPVDYYHNANFANNTSIVPYYQGNVLGKFPLPAMVEDPLRIFYIKDRDNIMKRVIALSEVDYGHQGTDDYHRVTQLKLFDQQEDISKYGGPVQIISQTHASLLNAGDAQLIVHLMNQGSGEVIATEEVLELTVQNYNSSDKIFDYFFQVTAASGPTTTFTYFQDQQVTSVGTNFIQPAIGGTASVSFTTTSSFSTDETVFIIGGGYYKIISITSSTVAVLQNLGTASNIAPTSTISANSLVGSYPTGVSTYTYTALNYILDIDNNLSLDLSYGGSTTHYVVGDTYRIAFDNPQVIQKILSGITDINAIFRVQYQQYRWRMTANSSGLKKGTAWGFPVEDPNGYDWISNFSNEGTVEEVAQAIANCVNSFSNLPAYATAQGSTIVLKAKLQHLDGNTIKFQRYPVSKKSYTKNLGFYEDGNVLTSDSIAQVTYPGLTLSSDSVKYTLDRVPEVYGEYYYYIKILKTNSGANIIVRKDVDTTSAYLITISGTYESFYETSNVLNNIDLPFTLDFTDVSLGSYQDFLIRVNAGSFISQMFVGGAIRNKERAKILLADGQRYYQDRRITISSSLTLGSSLVTVGSTEGVYVGAPVTGTEIPAGTVVLKIDQGHLVITLSHSATASGSFNLTYGNLSILNDTQFLQQWFQTAKKQFSRMQGWDVQGKWIYSLPYLDEPVMNKKNVPASYTDQNVSSIIEIEDIAQEFYLSQDLRIVAYKMYRPTIGVFSVFPVKEFDFDFFTSDYAYTPVIETFRYFFNETIQTNETVELPADENFVLIPQFLDPTDTMGIKKIAGTTGTFGFTLEGFNPLTDNWDPLSQISSVGITGTTPSNGIIINTYTPFYRYDENEHPQKYDDSLSYLIRGSGMRNYERTVLSTRNSDSIVEPVDVKKFRLTYAGNTGLPFLNIQKSDFSQDDDIKEFQGFAGLTPFLNQNDEEDIRLLKSEGNFVESFLRQLLASEYDRLKENYTKEYSTLSRVVPFINKWVQEGTDARENYYRLNTSLAFGLTNFSPDDSVDFAEPLILSHEFPYLDTLPKDYPEDAITGSRSYMFAKLSDITYEGKTWYDLITTDNTKDWFLKYFSVGYPTEIDYYGNLIPKSREERFTFFTYNIGIGRSQTLFRGAKIQVVDINTAQISLSENVSSIKYNGYKFAAIQRTIPYDFYAVQPPLEMEIIKNEIFKTIVLIITKREQDYRVQSGLQDYFSKYAVSDNLKNYNQQQYKITTFADSSTGDQCFWNPYVTTIATDYTTQATMRPRQLFVGGGRIQVGDPKLSGYLDTQNSPSYSSEYLSFFLRSSSQFYPFIVSDEVNPYQSKYTANTGTSYPYVYNYSSLPIISVPFAQEGFLDKFITTATNGNQHFTLDFLDTRQKADTILLDSLGFSSPTSYSYFKNPILSSSDSAGILTIYSSTSYYPFSGLETFNIEGGGEFYANTKSLTSFANIKKNINENNGLVKYYKVNSNGKSITTDFKIHFIAADQIILTGVLNYVVDEDKPPQYQNAPIIGYDIVNTNQNQLVIRHRGQYEPKANDTISFWVREDEQMTRHFDTDFLLANTHINSLSPMSGIIKNYGINKVSDGTLLKISEGAAYKSIYELIHEVAVDKKEVDVLNSTWDAGYYQKYVDLNIFSLVDGWEEMTEFKSFLGSKTMTVPKALDMGTFLDTEVTYTVSAPTINNGLITVTDAGTTKPTLIINLSLQSRLVRELMEGMELTGSVDDFEWARTNLGLTSDISDSELLFMKEEYITRNIVPLYQVSDVILYSLTKDGIPILVNDLSEGQKLSAGYRVDKDCVVRQLTNFDFTITKSLDTKLSAGFSVGVVIKRI